MFRHLPALNACTVIIALVAGGCQLISLSMPAACIVLLLQAQVPVQVQYRAHTRVLDQSQWQRQRPGNAQHGACSTVENAIWFSLPIIWCTLAHLAHARIKGDHLKNRIRKQNQLLNRVHIAPPASVTAQAIPAATCLVSYLVRTRSWLGSYVDVAVSACACEGVCVPRGKRIT